MFNKLSNSKLVIIFGAFLAIVLIVFLFDTGKNEKSFRTELTDVDTSKVTEVLLYPTSIQNKEVKIFKENDKWKVKTESGLIADVPLSKVSSLLNSAANIVPLRLSARDESKWKEFQVDSSATRVIIKEGSKKTLDIMIGRFSFQQQPRKMFTHVRLFDDVDVYQVEGFLQTTFNQKGDFFRDGTVLNISEEQVNKVSFTYPADSSFQIVRNGSLWMIDNIPADSSETVKYLRSLSNVTSTFFIDNPENSILQTADYMVQYELTDGNVVTLKAFDTEKSYLIQTSINSETYFDGTKSNLSKRIFKGKSDFLK